MIETPALAAFQRALRMAVSVYRGMPQCDFHAAVVELCRQGEASPDDTIISLLKSLAAAGSLEAAAALIVFADTADGLAEDVVEAIESVVSRSADITNELVVSALASEIGEVLDAEVAAGRMTVEVDPKSGEKLYGRAKLK